MLTPEERQRIEDEERKRIAEEQYRAEVRGKLQPTAAKKSNGLLWVLGIAAVLVVGVLLFLANYKSQSKTSDDATPAAPVAASSLPPLTPVAKTRYVPVSQNIASGQIVVKARGYVQYRITITPEMSEPEITGTFNASGGGGNDIQAVIADDTNYMNWINGHQAQVFWGTPGKQTTGSIQARLRPGMYYLVFSNKFSTFADKQVFLDVDLKYKKAETYY